MSAITAPSVPSELTNGIKIRLIETSKSDFSSAIKESLELIKSSVSHVPRVGYIANRLSERNSTVGLLGHFIQGLNEFKFPSVDVSSGVGALLHIFDTDGKKCLASAADVSTLALKKFLLPEIESIIDEEKTVNLSDLADRTEDELRNPVKLGLQQLQKDDIDSCYSPIILSGGPVPYDLKPSAQSANSQLLYEKGTAIIVQLGARFRNYCANIGRTYLIDPSVHQRKVYALLTQIYAACKQAMKPGNKASTVMSVYQLNNVIYFFYF